MRYASFGFRTPNLGDDLQALAAIAMLPSIDALVDRDRLDKVRLDEVHHVIMNSWFAVKRYKATPASCLSPHYFSYCVGRDELINPTWLAEWKRHAPIGCRDEHSVSKLKENGIDAHFTGCLTTWFGRFFKQPEKRQGVIFVDVPEAMEQFIPEDIRNRAERITNLPIKKIQKDQTARWKEIARISDRLRNAEMVITRRLHTALPCIGFGTPVSVYLEGTAKNRRRFSGHDRFVPMVFHDGEKPIGDTAYNPPRLVEIPDEMNERFLQLAKSLGASVEPRWNSISEFVDSLPSLDRQPASFW